jgi:hypothetical protein
MPAVVRAAAARRPRIRVFMRIDPLGEEYFRPLWIRD